jgi:hypothetical protein
MGEPGATASSEANTGRNVGQPRRCTVRARTHDTRALQHYMGHKNIMHTVRYTEMAPDRSKNFWKD